jgi:hypothetical protein
LDGVGDETAGGDHAYLDFVAFDVVNPNVDVD